jgi:ACS family tartrate transporter-like MFS transporter
MRFLLGAAEAGFFPGVILYLTFWFTTRERARAVAMFAVGGVVAGVMGSPISGGILTMHGFGGLAGWQWLFLLEAIPAVLLGFVVLFVLPNGPQDARWLSPAERACVRDRLAVEAAVLGHGQEHRLSQVFASGRVWLLCLIYFLLNVGSYGYELWLPSIIKGFSGKGDAIVGFINALPYLAAGIAMLIVSRHSDRTGERRRHVALGATASAIGFAASAYFKNPVLAMAGLTIAFAGLKCCVAPFWAIATTFMASTAAAGGIALINSVGNLGGFFGPSIVGMIKDKTGTNVAALAFLGCALLTMAVLTLAVAKSKSSGAPERNS